MTDPLGAIAGLLLLPVLIVFSFVLAVAQWAYERLRGGDRTWHEWVDQEVYGK